MKFREGDILVRKSKDGNVVWISQRLVVMLCELDVVYFSKAARVRYKSSVQPCHRHHAILPDTTKGWRWAKMNNDFYYDLKRIPNRKPAYFRERFGDADELVRKYDEAMKDSSDRIMEIEFNSHVRSEYKSYMHCYAEGHSEAQRVALSKACAVLEFTVTQVMDNEAKGSWMYRRICGIIEQKGMMYLPKNYRKLKEKVDMVLYQQASITEVIKLPRAGNTNALIYNDPQVVSWGMQLRSMGQNYANDYIIRKIQKVCRLTGKAVPSRRWFGQNIFELPKTKFLTASSRFGYGSRKAQTYEGYIPMEGALYAGDCWQIDATRVNIIEHEKDEGGKGFLFVIAVRDVHSGDIIGYSFDYSENRWSVVNALKMAVVNAGYLPYEIVSDRFPGHNTEEIKTLIHQLEVMGVKYTITHKATGKSHVERCFGTIQSVIMQDSKYYYGEGVQSRRESAHRSSDYLKEIRREANKEKFGLTDAYAECTEIVETYRNTKLSEYSRKHAKVDKSPRMLHDESEKPHTMGISESGIYMLFANKKTIGIRNNGMIKTEIQKAEYIYHVEDYEVFSTTEKVVMAYDLEDLDKVYLYRQEETLLVYLGDAVLFDKPNPYGPQAEFGKIATEKKRLSDINERKKLDLEKATEGAGEVELIMGRHTNKQKAEEAETIRTLNSLKNMPMKKAVGSGITDSPDDQEIDINEIIINKY